MSARPYRGGKKTLDHRRKIGAANKGKVITFQGYFKIN